MQVICLIMGFFWKQERGEPFPFTGSLRLKDDGSFEGETKDAFGEATIKGAIVKEFLNPLCFTKEYLPRSTGGATKPIRYVLESVKHPARGGWRGYCAVKQPNEPGEPETIWQAACIIFPC